MTPEHLQILQHALGLDKYGRGASYRNRFCAGGKDENLCKELVGMGFMVQHETTRSLPYYNCSVTERGRRAVASESPQPPKLTRSQIRYQKYLDADSGRSFKEWLKYRKSCAA